MPRLASPYLGGGVVLRVDRLSVLDHRQGDQTSGRVDSLLQLVQPARMAKRATRLRHKDSRH